MKTKYIIAFAAAALMLAGCSRSDLDVESSVAGDGLLKFRVAGAGVKGALINNEEQMLAAGVDSFMVESWNKDCTKFVQLQKVSYDKEAAEWQTAKPIDWKGGDTKTFFAYTNLTAGATVVNTCTPGTPAVRKQTLAYTLPQDAREQNDVMLGWYEGDGDGETTATVTFVHPLSSIKLVRGAMNVDSIQSITISGLYASGIVDVSYALGAEDKVVPDSSWITRTGNVASTLEPEDGKHSLEIADDGTIGTPFIVIPQESVSDVKVTVNAMLNGKEKVLSVKFPAGVTKLEAGKTYVLTLGYGAFTFSLTNPADAILSFNNTTTDSAPKEILLTSTLSMDGVTQTPAEWFIKSVQVGLGDAVPVGGASVEIEGLNIVKEGDKLKVTASRRELVTPSNNDYWRNTSSRTDCLGWSPADWNGKETIDLSRFDPYTDTENAHAMTTANCYIIRHAGTYKLPLVYGNGVMEGTENKQSYYPNVIGDIPDGDTRTEETDGNYRLVKFQNHLGNDITSAFIENNADCGGSDLKCAVIWQDKAEVVKSLQIVNGAAAGSAGSYTASDVRYLQFTISQDDICQNNALICIYKDKVGGTADKYDSGEAIWSWHIWTTNDPTLLSGPIAVWNNSTPSVEYDFFPLYNLGWINKGCYPAREDVKIVLAQQKLGKEMEITVKQSSVLGEASNGCYYQFGRKDPMPTKENVTGFTPNATGGSISNAICNPGKFYLQIADDNNDWCTTTYYNLWSGKKSTIGTFDQDENPDIIKTIYDPSPVGYKLPASNAYTGFTTTGDNTSASDQFNVEGEFAGGWTFYTKTGGKAGDGSVFFPAAGYRRRSNGSVYDEGSYGYYWSAVPSSVNNGYDLYFHSARVSPLSSNTRASGFSVRPVQE